MKIYTSYFSNRVLKDIDYERQVAISIGLPRYRKWLGRRIKQLAPTWEMVKMPEPEYRIKYQNILDNLNPSELDIRDCDILLCFEMPDDFCHRHLVAEWLRKYGYEVEELIYPGMVQSEGRRETITQILVQPQFPGLFVS